MSPSQRPLPDKYTTLTTNIHALGGIPTRNPSKQLAADPRLRPPGHWDRQLLIIRSRKRASLIPPGLGLGLAPLYSCPETLPYFVVYSVHWGEDVELSLVSHTSSSRRLTASSCSAEGISWQEKLRKLDKRKCRFVHQNRTWTAAGTNATSRC
jgi:hypothetical protein